MNQLADSVNWEQGFVSVPRLAKIRRVREYFAARKAASKSQKQLPQKPEKKPKSAKATRTPRPYVEPASKPCSACGRVFAIGEYYVLKKKQNTRPSRESRCRNCITKSARMRRYHLTAEEYDRLFTDPSCEICGQAELSKLVVDHDHTSGDTRGLLCQKCNVLVGVIEASDIGAALRYLTKHGSPKCAITHDHTPASRLAFFGGNS